MMDTRVVFANLKAFRQINGIAVDWNQVRVLGNPDFPFETTKRTRSAWIRGSKEGTRCQAALTNSQLVTRSPGRPVLGPGGRLCDPKMAAGLALLAVAAMAVGRSSDSPPPAHLSVWWKCALSFCYPCISSRSLFNILTYE